MTFELLWILALYLCIELLPERDVEHFTNASQHSSKPWPYLLEHAKRSIEHQFLSVRGQMRVPRFEPIPAPPRVNFPINSALYLRLVQPV